MKSNKTSKKSNGQPSEEEKDKSSEHGVDKTKEIANSKRTPSYFRPYDPDYYWEQ